MSSSATNNRQEFKCTMHLLQVNGSVNVLLCICEVLNIVNKINDTFMTIRFTAFYCFQSLYGLSFLFSAVVKFTPQI